MKVFQSITFKCASCLQETECGPHTSNTSYEILKIRKRLHRNCFNPLKRLKYLSTMALSSYIRKRKDHPAMVYDIGWRYGYYQGIFSAYLIHKHKKLSFIKDDLDTCLKNHQRKWEENQKLKKANREISSTEYDGNIDGKISGLKEAIKLLGIISPKPCIEVSIC